MKAAAMTKNGSAISVAEFTQSVIFCATATSGRPLTAEQDRRAEAQHHENRHPRHQQPEEHQHDKQCHHGLSPWRCASTVMVAGSKRKP